MKVLRRYTVISLFMLGAATIAGYMTLLAYGRYAYGGPMSGISASEFFEGTAPLITDSARIGLLALAAMALCWLLGFLWLPALSGSQMAMPMKITLLLVPLSLAVVYMAMGA
ncbi:hypothetical protein [Nitrolancea hollandica]|uniref:Uncharacterized protein n=1 Tax=Nitrolancea hollandica Lb TaxID=1129897 RepID=I4EIP5_9BACT|nr:hypothetical protein [Nitrolancea hollandica]CCF84557.1 membrane hypothetical protein [Nitrolancea hollandica Lb]